MPQPIADGIPQNVRLQTTVNLHKSERIVFAQVRNTGVPLVKKKIQDTNFSKFQDNFRTFSASKTSVNVDEASFLQASHHKKIFTTEKLWNIGTLSRTNMGQKSKIDKKAYRYVNDIGVDLSGNLDGSSLLECAPLLSKSGVRGWNPRENFENQYSIWCILMHSLVFQDNSGHFYHFSGQLNISGQIQDINEISGNSGISGQVGPLETLHQNQELQRCKQITQTSIYSLHSW